MGDCMIEYILRDQYGMLEISEDGQVTHRDISLLGLLNQISYQSLRSVETTLKLTQKLLQCTHKIPLYINPSILLIQLRTIRSKNPFLLNYFAIAKLLPTKGKGITVFFKSGAHVKYDASKPLRRQLELSIIILESLESNSKNKKVFT